MDEESSLQWENGLDSLLMELESSSDSSESESDSLEESSSSEVFLTTLEQEYNTGHFTSYSDFTNVGMKGVLLGFGMAIVFALITLAFNAALNIIKKGVS